MFFICNMIDLLFGNTGLQSRLGLMKINETEERFFFLFRDDLFPFFKCPLGKILRFIQVDNIIYKKSMRV